jgi:RNA recognition motif-containing protein
MNMYVSNLGFQVTDEDLKSLFVPFGEVESVKIITDRETGRSRGFAFVEMSDEAAEKAMQELDGAQIQGRAIVVSQARPKSDNRNSSRSNDRSGYRY